MAKSLFEELGGKYERQGSGKLNVYLADIDRQAQERFERLIEGMKQAQGITERIKEKNALEWVQHLNSIRACTKEIVNEEIIFA